MDTLIISANVYFKFVFHIIVFLPYRSVGLVGFIRKWNHLIIMQIVTRTKTTAQLIMYSRWCKFYSFYNIHCGVAQVIIMYFSFVFCHKIYRTICHFGSFILPQSCTLPIHFFSSPANNSIIRGFFSKEKYLMFNLYI